MLPAQRALLVDWRILQFVAAQIDFYYAAVCRHLHIAQPGHINARAAADMHPRGGRGRLAAPEYRAVAAEEIVLRIVQRNQFHLARRRNNPRSGTGNGNTRRIPRRALDANILAHNAYPRRAVERRALRTILRGRRIGRLGQDFGQTAFTHDHPAGAGGSRSAGDTRKRILGEQIHRPARHHRRSRARNAHLVHRIAHHGDVATRRGEFAEVGDMAEFIFSRVDQTHCLAVELAVLDAYICGIEIVEPCRAVHLDQQTIKLSAP